MNYVNSCKLFILFLFACIFIFFISFVNSQTATPGIIQDSSTNYNISYQFDNGKIVEMPTDLNLFYYGTVLNFVINDTALVNISDYVGAFWGCVKIDEGTPKSQYIVCLANLGIGECKLVGTKKVCQINISKIPAAYPWIDLQIESITITSPKFNVNYSTLSNRPLDTDHIWILPIVTKDLNNYEETGVTLKISARPKLLIAFNESSLIFDLIGIWTAVSDTIFVQNFYTLPLVKKFAKKKVLPAIPLIINITYPEHNLQVITLEKTGNIYRRSFNITFEFYNQYLKSLSFNKDFLFQSGAGVTFVQDKLTTEYIEFYPTNFTVSIMFNKSTSNCNFSLGEYIYIKDKETDKILEIIPKFDIILSIFSSNKITIYNLTIPRILNYSSDTLILIPVNISCLSIDPPQIKIKVWNVTFTSNVNVWITSQKISLGEILYNYNSSYYNVSRIAIITAKTSTDQFLIDKYSTERNSMTLSSNFDIKVYLFKAAEIDPTSDYFKLKVNLTYPATVSEVKVYYYNASSNSISDISSYCQTSTGTQTVSVECNITSFQAELLTDRIIVEIRGSTTYNLEPFCAYVYALIEESGITYDTLKDSFCIPGCKIEILNITYNNNVSSDILKRIFFAPGNLVKVVFRTTCPNFTVVRNCTENGCYQLIPSYENVSCVKVGSWKYCNLTINISSLSLYLNTLNYYILGTANTTAWLFFDPKKINISNLPDYIKKQGDYKGIDVFQLYPTNVKIIVPYYSPLSKISTNLYVTNYSIIFEYSLPPYCTEVCKKIPVYAVISYPFNFDKNVNSISNINITGYNKDIKVVVTNQSPLTSNPIHYYFALLYNPYYFITTNVTLLINITGNLDWPIIYYSPELNITLYNPYNPTENITYTYVYSSNLSLRYNYTILPYRWIIPYYQAFVSILNNTPDTLFVLIPFYVVSNETLPKLEIENSLIGGSIIKIYNISIFPPARSVTISGNKIIIQDWNITAAYNLGLIPVVGYFVKTSTSFSPSSEYVSLNYSSNINLIESEKTLGIDVKYYSNKIKPLTIYCYPNNTLNFITIPEKYLRNVSSSGSFIHKVTLKRLSNTVFRESLVCGGFLPINVSIPLRINLSIYSSSSVIKHNQIVNTNSSTGDVQFSNVIYSQFKISDNGVCVGYDVKNVEIIINNTGSSASNVEFIINITDGITEFYGAQIVYQINASCTLTYNTNLRIINVSCTEFKTNGSVGIKLAIVQNDSKNYTYLNVSIYVNNKFIITIPHKLINCGKPTIYIAPEACKYSKTDKAINSSAAIELKLKNGYPWNKSITVSVYSTCFIPNSVSTTLNETKTSDVIYYLVYTTSEGCCCLNASASVPNTQYNVFYKCNVSICRSVCAESSCYVGHLVDVRYLGPSYYSEPNKQLRVSFKLIVTEQVGENVTIYKAVINLSNAKFEDGSTSQTIIINKTLSPGDTYLITVPKAIITPANRQDIKIYLTLYEYSPSVGNAQELYSYIIYSSPPAPVICDINMKFNKCTFYGCELPGVLNITVQIQCSDGKIHPIKLKYQPYSYNGTILLTNLTSQECRTSPCKVSYLINVSKLGTWGYVYFTPEALEYGIDLDYTCSCKDCRIIIDSRAFVNVTILDIITVVNGEEKHKCYCPDRYSTIKVNITNHYPFTFYPAIVNYTFTNGSKIVSTDANYNVLIPSCGSTINTKTMIPSHKYYSSLLLNVSVYNGSVLLGYTSQIVDPCSGCEPCYRVSGTVEPSVIDCTMWNSDTYYYYYDNVKININVIKYNDPSCPVFDPKIYINVLPPELNNSYSLKCTLVNEKQSSDGLHTYINLSYNCTLYKAKKLAVSSPITNVNIEVYFRPAPSYSSTLIGTITDTCFSNVNRICIVKGQWIHDALDLAVEFENDGSPVLVPYICGWENYFIKYKGHECWTFIANKGWADLSNYTNCTYSIPLAEKLYAEGKTNIRDVIRQLWFAGGLVFPWNETSSAFKALSCGDLNDPTCVQAILNGEKFYRPNFGFCCGNCNGLGTCKLVNDSCICVPNINNPCLYAAVLVCAYKVIKHISSSCSDACQDVIDSVRATQWCQQIVSSVNNREDLILNLLKEAFVITPNGRPKADENCGVGEICKIVIGKLSKDRSFKEGFRAGQCVPAALEFGDKCSDPWFEYYIHYTNFETKCQDWFVDAGLSSLVNNLPEICEYIRTGCEVSAGGEYAIAYNFTFKGLGWIAGCGGYPCVNQSTTPKMVEQIYIVYRNGSQWLWCRFGSSDVKEEGDCDVIINIIKQLGGLEAALKNPNFKFLKIKVPIYLANKTVISFEGNDIYILGQVKIPRGAVKVFATIKPNNEIVINWALLRKPRYIPSVPETPCIILLIIITLVCSIILYKKRLKEIK